MSRLIQEETELRLSKKTLDRKFRKEVESNPDLMEVFRQCVADLDKHYLGGDHYPQKNARLALLTLDDDIIPLMHHILFVTCKFNRLSLSNLCGQCAGSVNATTQYYKLQTVGEVAAYMGKHGLLGLIMPRDAESGMLTIQNYFTPSQEFRDHAAQCMYLPPMVCKPDRLTHNKDSVWLVTPFGSLITKKFNHHDGDISLDVINRKNRIPLSLSQEFLTQVDEVYSDNVATDPEKLAQYQRFQAKSYEVFKYIICNGNRMYLPHKKDKRNRTYAQGYHCSYQGNSFRKAMVEFADKEIVEGV